MYNVTVRHNIANANFNIEAALETCRHHTAMLFEDAVVTHSDNCFHVTASKPRHANVKAFDLINGNNSVSSCLQRILMAASFEFQTPVEMEALESVVVGAENFESRCVSHIDGVNMAKSEFKLIELKDHDSVVVSHTDVPLSDLRRIMSLGREILVAVNAPREYLTLMDGSESLVEEAQKQIDSVLH